MFTRKDYLNSVENATDSHRRYYGGIIEAMGGADSIQTPFSDNQVRAAIAADDPHLNTLPLSRWDRFAAHLSGAHMALQARGDYITLAGSVCILKEAARLKVAGR